MMWESSQGEGEAKIPSSRLRTCNDVCEINYQTLFQCNFERHTKSRRA